MSDFCDAEYRTQFKVNLTLLVGNGRAGLTYTGGQASSKPSGTNIFNTTKGAALVNNSVSIQTPI